MIGDYELVKIRWLWTKKSLWPEREEEELSEPGPASGPEDHSRPGFICLQVSEAAVNCDLNPLQTAPTSALFFLLLVSHLPSGDEGGAVQSLHAEVLLQRDHSELPDIRLRRLPRQRKQLHHQGQV